MSRGRKSFRGVRWSRESWKIVYSQGLCEYKWKAAKIDHVGLPKEARKVESDPPVSGRGGSWGYPVRSAPGHYWLLLASLHHVHQKTSCVNAWGAFENIPEVLLGVPPLSPSQLPWLPHPPIFFWFSFWFQKLLLSRSGRGTYFYRLKMSFSDLLDFVLLSYKFPAMDLLWHIWQVWQNWFYPHFHLSQEFAIFFYNGPYRKYS